MQGLVFISFVCLIVVVLTRVVVGLLDRYSKKDYGKVKETCTALIGFFMVVLLVFLAVMGVKEFIQNLS
ncbi:MAG TPA: hypothetical protein VKP03_03070 [Patescibacteria group bacterium]|nr:hypothetical protein [Patescibacteria group bacterium]